MPNSQPAAAATAIDLVYVLCSRHFAYEGTLFEACSLVWKNPAKPRTDSRWTGPQARGAATVAAWVACLPRRGMLSKRRLY